MADKSEGQHVHDVAIAGSGPGRNHPWRLPGAQ
jgi:hypothetical protein